MAEAAQAAGRKRQAGATTCGLCIRLKLFALIRTRKSAGGSQMLHNRHCGRRGWCRRTFHDGLHGDPGECERHGCVGIPLLLSSADGQGTATNTATNTATDTTSSAARLKKL